MQYKKFKSPKDDIHIADTSGHCMILNDREFRDVPEFFWGLAYSAGALTPDMQVSSITSFIEEKKQEIIAKEEEERKKIKDKMRQAYLEPVTFLDLKGKLIQRKIVSLLGQPIKKDLMDEIWAELVAEGEEK
jgi:hypothetical protein